MTDVWAYQVTVTEPVELAGFDVVASDGEIGRVDEATSEAGKGSIVVDTGWWLFGKKRMIPAGTISAIDVDGRKVHVRCTKAQIKGAPDFDVHRRHQGAFREDHESYYWGY